MTGWRDTIGQGPEAWEAYYAAKDRARAVAARRKPPMAPNPGKGRCAWCLGEIRYPEGHKRAGMLNVQRGWHAHCLDFYKVASWGDATRWAVFQRDGGRCALCPPGTLPCVGVFVRWRRYPREVIVTPHGLAWFAKLQLTPDGDLGRSGPNYSSAVEPVMRPTSWHADHIVPLWSIAGAEIEQRGCFWSLANIWTLCDRHHREKTSREAAARAIWRKRLAEAATSGP